ncbi:site-specific integrase [Clostridium botulinum]|uniref:Phage integrase n=1 Tax=Clostridium botulinum (strain Kyoto / Type A2) TaxID=536232 RepID=C1FM70_CLOBJ|nr:site-specific integrase [Clostridium botulinum]ACO84363.1 phage integrase [Clostridium botulinum A2 str. Kyoto]AUN06611.1 site-specific integrase [Clostridium botulinum]MBN3365661.1 site-specific integrase [Clostridium botulinum]MBN3376286.1 site-specific integrase [Clostridium botulinum]MBN3392351.1 site-specific integrase [Clostridium botulinum]
MAVYKNEERGTYFCTFYYTDWTGKKKRKKKEGFKRQKDAKDYERDFLNKQKNDPGINFENLVNIYLDDIKNKIRFTTFRQKKLIVDLKIAPYFKDINLNNITPNHIRKWQNKIMENDYSDTYLRTINNQLSAIFNFAIRYYNLSSNPVVKAGPMGKKNADVMQFWTVEEFKTFIEYVKKPIYKLAFKILFWTGIRSGELLALTYKDIDLDRKIININKNYARINKKDIINPPKTLKSKREVTISDFLCEDIKEYKNKIYNLNENERIFTIAKQNINAQLNRTCKKSGIKKIRLHDLRHSHASLLIELGFTPLLISERLGHENIETTLNTYSHLYPNKHTEVAKELDKLY